MKYNFKQIAFLSLMSIGLGCGSTDVDAASYRYCRSGYNETVEPRIWCKDVSLQRVLALISRYEEGNELLQRACRGGSIQVRWASLGANGAEALWDDNSRSVIVNQDRSSSDGQRLCWVVFELHNALTTQEFDDICLQAKRGRLTKDGYVRAVEEHEHRNALQASALLERGVKAGLYPQGASWPVTKDFEDHYRMQQLMGHSLWIAEQYDAFFGGGRVHPFYGTIPGLARLSAVEKDLLLRYLVAKQSYEEGSFREKAQARDYLHQEFRRGLAGKANRLRLLRVVMGENSTLEKSVREGRRLV